ncbi:AAEL017444-PA [Aedes aegypti]|uniref:AAEL017444-PA n=1 Tax=Aedes aegypti TaxID=7159 RepID=J9HIC7_AEDAE|nr:AAEL017444-PA [Aedes aegypti]
MAAKIVILFVLGLFASGVLSAPAPKADPKAHFLAAAPLAYSVDALPYAAYSSYVSPYTSVVSPYAAAYTYPGLGNDPTSNSTNNYHSFR